MDDYFKKEMIAAISDITDALLKKDGDVLKEISERIVHSASLYDDSDGITLGIVAYSLAKIISRRKAYSFDDWDTFTYKMRSSLDSALQAINRGDIDGYRYFIRKLIEVIRHSDKQMKFYIGDILRDAQVRKGSSLYQEGLSVGLIADLTGVSEWEIMNYVGKTAVIEHVQHNSNVSGRLETARKLFSRR